MAIPSRRVVLTQEEVAQLHKLLHEAGASRVCWRCGHEDLSIGNRLTFIDYPNEGIDSLGNSLRLPAASIICPKCGLSALHMLDILDPDVTVGREHE